MSGDFVGVTDGIGDTAATDIKLTTVPEVCAHIGWAVVDALADKRSSSYAYMGSGVGLDDDVDALIINVEIVLPRPRLLWLLRTAGLLSEGD